MSLSKKKKASDEGEWIVLTTVLPFSRASFCSNMQMLRALKESRPEVGSSSSKTEGSETSSTPMEHLFRSPPERTLR